MKSNKKKIIIPILLLLLLIGIRGTIAWLTATDEIINEFTLGEIKSPTTDPSGNPLSISGNLYEKDWDPTIAHKIIPGASFTKEPYVGIGKGSEEAVVYVYVENDFPNNVYFTLASGWTAVSSKSEAGPAAGTYERGLFKYNTNLVPTDTDDAWTTKLFDHIYVANNASVADLTPAGATSNITLKSLVHQAKDASNNTIDLATIEATAISTLCP